MSDQKPTTPAAELRKAAETVREIANDAASLGDEWNWGDLVMDDEAAAQIDLWSPPLGLAVVVLLDIIALDMETSGVDMPGYGWSEATALARLINGDLS